MATESIRRHGFDALLAHARRVCRLASWFGGSLFIGISFIVTVEIILRKFFDTSIGGADEISGYALASAASWSFGFAVLDRAHIRVDSLYLLAPSRLRAMLDIVAIAALLLFFTLLLYFAFVMFDDTVRIDAHSRTSLYVPLVIPEAFWIVGLLLSVGVTSILLLRLLVAAFDRDFQLIIRLAGSKSAEEELEEELANLEAQHKLERQRSDQSL